MRATISVVNGNVSSDFARKSYDVRLAIAYDIKPAPTRGRAAYRAMRDLRSRKVQIRFDRLNFERAIVYFKGERMGEARPVDFVGNDRKPSKKSVTAPPPVVVEP